MSDDWEAEYKRARRIEAQISGHRVPDSVRYWEAPTGRGRIDSVQVCLGQVDDGRWYVERLAHGRAGPYRARLYASEADAHTVARAVMDEAEQLPGVGEFVEVDG